MYGQHSTFQTLTNSINFHGDAGVIMELETTRFGKIEIDKEKIITLTKGILGFPDSLRYVLIPHKPGSPFYWLQSVDRPDLAFVVIEPGQFFADYVFDVDDETQSQLQITDAAEVTVLVIVTFARGTGEITANLLGPVVINTEKRIGCQMVLDPNRYPVRYPLSKELRRLQKGGQ